MAKKNDVQTSLITTTDDEGKGRQSSYVVRMADVPTEMQRAIGTGALDKTKLSRDEQKQVMTILAVLRSTLWKLDVAWFTRRDAIDVQAFIASGAMPSDVAKALAGASLTPFWRNRDHITFQQLLNGYGAFVTRYNEHAAGRVRKPDNRNEIVALLSQMMVEIAACAPYYSSQFEQLDLARLSVEELRRHLDDARKIVSKYGRKTGEQ